MLDLERKDSSHTPFPHTNDGLNEQLLRARY